MNASNRSLNAVIDHIFICCSTGGAEADALTRLGLKEGSANTHPGQGTACRRFFFSNAYLELLWISDRLEARAEATRPTRLWERWTMRDESACPFGIVLRPADDAPGTRAPFPSWPYTPQYLPEGASIDVAIDTPLSGPEFFYAGFLSSPTGSRNEPVDHEPPMSALTGVSVWRPADGTSEAAKAVDAAGLVRFHDADECLMELRFDDASRGSADLRPGLPLILRW